MNERRKRKCIICEKVFEYNTARGHKGSGARPIRSKRCLTCSKKCAKAYMRVLQWVRWHK